MKAILMTSLCAAVLGVAIPAAAHHSMAGFDRTKTTTVTGTVVEFKWANPHSWIEVAVPGDDGKTVNWNFEMTAPAYLVRAGWKSSSVKAGDKVTITGNPMVSGEPGALFVSVTLEDGTTLTQRAGGPPKGKGKGKGKGK